MEAQQIFDTVANHLRQQNSKSLLSEVACREIPAPTGSCAYRGEAGKKCSAGVLILDEEYEFSMEGRGLYSVLTKYSSSLMERLYPHHDLIVQLQSVHDNFGVEEWEERLKLVAARFKLRY
jgi:hypothetical protein